MLQQLQAKNDTTDPERSRQIDRLDQRSPSKQSITGVASRKFVGGALRDYTKKGWRRQQPGPFGEKRKKSLYLQKEKETKLYYLCPMIFPTRQTFVRRLFVFQTGISVACEP